MARGWEAHEVDCVYHDEALPALAPVNPRYYLEGGNRRQVDVEIVDGIEFLSRREMAFGPRLQY